MANTGFFPVLNIPPKGGLVVQSLLSPRRKDWSALGIIESESGELTIFEVDAGPILALTIRLPLITATGQICSLKAIDVGLAAPKTATVEAQGNNLISGGISPLVTLFDGTTRGKSLTFISEKTDSASTDTWYLIAYFAGY